MRASKDLAGVRKARDRIAVGQNDPDDLSGLTSLFHRFRHVSYMERAIDIWTQADDLIARLRDLAEQLRTERNERERSEQATREAEARRRAEAIHLELSPRSVTVAADRIQIEQVVLSLLHNGFDAMDGTPLADRAITIRTALEGDAACIGVSDHGIGLAPDVQSRVFEQFFTTKGGGMGMGLAISRSIVEAHGGHLWATSDKSRGATFWVRLPAEPARGRAAAHDRASGDRLRARRDAPSHVA